VADQVYGREEEHALVRAVAARYMALEAAFFQNYVTDDEGGWGAVRCHRVNLAVFSL
jgi:hypothetical protein